MIATRVSWRFAEITNSLVIRLPPRESRVEHRTVGALRGSWYPGAAAGCRHYLTQTHAGRQWSYNPRTLTGREPPASWESAFAPRSPGSLPAPEILYIAPSLTLGVLNHSEILSSLSLPLGVLKTQNRDTQR